MAEIFYMYLLWLDHGTQHFCVCIHEFGRLKGVAYFVRFFSLVDRQ